MMQGASPIYYWMQQLIVDRDVLAVRVALLDRCCFCLSPGLVDKMSVQYNEYVAHQVQPAR